METIATSNDLLAISINIHTTPLVIFKKEDGTTNAQPNIGSAGNLNGFTVYLDAVLKYDALSHIINQYLKNKRISVTEGIINQHIILDDNQVYGDDTGHIKIKTDFSGSFDGTFFFTGIPVYDAATQTMEIQSLSYDITTKNILLKAAKWLFNKKIENELKKHTVFSLQNVYHSASQALTALLSKEWTKGIDSTGSITDLYLESIRALPQHLLIRTYCKGNLAITINEKSLVVIP